MERTPDEGAPELGPEETEHARRVLRLTAGDACLGLDGRGAAWPLRVVAVDSGRIGLEVAGEAQRSAAPGETGCALPWVELAISWPRKQRAEAMLARLVQLGVAAIRPLALRQRGPEPVPKEPPERWWRVAREACKQSGRHWLPELHGATSLETLIGEREGASSAYLDPRGALPFDLWLRSLRPAPLGPGTRARPITVYVGPEGGFTAKERDLLRSGHAQPVWLGPHVLRIETAAEAAMAIAGVTLGTQDPST